VLGGEGEVGSPHRSPGLAEAVEGLGARDLVDQVEVDVEEIGFPRCPGHHVAVPYLLAQSSRFGHVHPFSASADLLVSIYETMMSTDGTHDKRSRRPRQVD